MSTPTIEVRPHLDGGWAIYQDRELVPVAKYRLKSVAVIVARFLGRYLHEVQGLRSVELVIKDRKARIRQKDTYGYDPESSRG